MAPGDQRSPQGEPTPGGVRASDRDRDAALELLAGAASDGRLSLEEYAGRVDRALAARTLSELEPLAADLERADRQRADDAPHELTAILGNESRKGQWRVPARLVARSLLGDCHIDLRHANLTAPVTTIEARATLGAITVLVPEGVQVRLSGRVILGAKSCTVHSRALTNAPVIDVRANVLCGNVSVRPPKLQERVRDRPVAGARDRSRPARR